MDQPDHQDMVVLSQDLYGRNLRETHYDAVRAFANFPNAGWKS